MTYFTFVFCDIFADLRVMRDNYNHSPTTHTKAQKPHAITPTSRPQLSQDSILERHPISDQRL